MINGKKVLAITLARGGSTKIKKKNIVDINGKPLLQYTTDEVKKSKYIDNYAVSTDDKEIAHVCTEMDVPYYWRNNENATDIAKSSDALIEVVNYFGGKYDYIVEVMCTNPLKTVEDIDGCIERIEEAGGDSVVSVVRIYDHHPARLKYLDEHNVMQDFVPEILESRRQDLTPPAYIRNGSIYVMTKNFLLTEKSRYNKSSQAYIMSEDNTINIDEKRDLLIAKYILQERNGLKVLCITPVSHIEGLVDMLEQCGDVTYKVDIDRQGARDSLLRDKYNVIYTNPNKMTFRIDEELLKGTSVEIVCTASTGTNHIDMNYCEKNNIEVISLTVDYEIIEKITSTAEMAFTLMLSLIRNLPKAVDGVKKYDWNYENYIGRQLNCLDVGIIGYGRLGKHYARFCEPFFRNIFITDPYKKVDDKYYQTDFDHLLKESDVVVLHVHLNDDTYHMINETTISKMKNGAYLVNTSRGDIVDEEAVIDAIKSGKLKGYATDVISDELCEGLENSSLIKAMKEGHNIIISPHIAGMTKEAQELAYRRVATRLLEKINEK
jgi:lactate dehydrogenase-like 2-hydroxyacid dehydrogenase/CMP-N-acetylneuraminic acid synthetase